METLTSAIEVATRIGYEWAVNVAIDNLADLHADAGRWSAALDLLERSAATASGAAMPAGWASRLARWPT